MTTLTESNRRFLQLADMIEKAGDGSFDLRRFIGVAGDDPSDDVLAFKGANCGTTACVAGWANFAARGGRRPITETQAKNTKAAADWLGITTDQALKLFFADNPDTVWAKYANKYGWDLADDGWLYGLADWTQIKARQAAKVLRDIGYRRVRL